MKGTDVEVMERAPEAQPALVIVPPSRAQVFARRGLAIVKEICWYLVVLTVCAFILLPVCWMLTAALKPDLAPIYTVTPQWFPSHYWHWDNFYRAMVYPLFPFLRYMINTLFVVFANILGVLISCSLVAYPFARMKFRFREPLFYLLIITMLVPWQSLVVPQFFFFYHLGWYGTYLPLIVPSFGGNAFFIFLIRQYMRSIPKELDEAARVDGMNYFQIYWRIILPLSVPVLTVCAVFTFIWNWNNLLGPLLYLNNNSQFTIAIGLANMFQNSANSKTNLLMAANLLSMIPPAIVFLVIQKRLIGGIATLGLKG
jgi:multiple sugar transport system permease protein